MPENGIGHIHGNAGFEKQSIGAYVRRTPRTHAPEMVLRTWPAGGRNSASTATRTAGS